MEFADIIICGPRLEGAPVGFFSGEPQNADTMFYSAGIDSVCKKKRFPPPGKVDYLKKNVDIKTVISVPPYERLLQASQTSDIYGYYVTPRAAWAAMIAAPLVVEDLGYGIPENNQCAFDAYPFYPSGYGAKVVHNQIRYDFPRNLFEDDFFTNDKICFQLRYSSPLNAFAAPVLRYKTSYLIDGVPGEGGLNITPLDGLDYVFDIQKPAADFEMLVVFIEFYPDSFSFEDGMYLSGNPPSGYPAGAVIVNKKELFDIVVCNVLGCPYVRISEEDARLYQYIGLLAPDLKRFVGPAIPIHDAF